MNRLFRLRRTVLLVPLLFLALSGCVSSLSNHGELRTPNTPVSIPDILGSWYVQAYLPTVVDRNTFNATYEFQQRRDGSMRVIYAFHGSEAQDKITDYEFKAEIDDTTTNADWDLQIVWPFEADFRIIYVAPDYSSMVVGHPNRRYLYILAQEKNLPEPEYQWLLDLVASEGFDTSFIRRVPQN